MNCFTRNAFRAPGTRMAITGWLFPVEFLRAGPSFHLLSSEL